MQHADPEFKKAHSERIKKSWENPERREIQSQRGKERYGTKEAREVHGKRMSEVLQDPKLRLKLSINNPKSLPVTIEGITYPSARAAIKATGLGQSHVKRLAKEQKQR